jgi:hypothetical protein
MGEFLMEIPDFLYVALLGYVGEPRSCLKKVHF